MNDNSEVIKRAIEMLRVAREYCEKWPEETVDYDGTTCDGYCIMDDCAYSADDLEFLLNDMENTND